MKVIRFLNKEYLFGGESLDEGGFVATREQYENGVASFAHYYPDQGVMRYRQQIGTRADVEIIGDVAEPEMKDEAVLNMLIHPSWNQP